ncbi:MAG: hypothetical protein LUF01_17640, partial [Bacteroides sp.]|nr:hypothetical protein [Bacteroides sp.]
QLEVFCKAADGETLNDVQTTWGNIKSIELLDAYPQMTYNYTTNEITYTGDKTNIPLSLNTNESGITAIGDGTATAVGMYAPAELVILRITTEVTHTVNDTESTTEELIRTFAVQFVKDGNNVNFEVGNKYTVTILFPSTIDYPQIKVMVDNWTTAQASDGLGDNQGITPTPEGWEQNNNGNDITDEIGNKPTT